MNWQCGIDQALAFSQDKSCLLIDARAVEDRLSTGMPTGAEFMHWSTLRGQLDTLLLNYQKVLLLCAVGQESLDYCRQLSANYQGRVFSVEGGFDAWFMSDFPIQTFEATHAQQRYDRQMRLTAVGQSGQEKLLSSHVLIVGAGGLGVPALQYLAAAGVGRITLVDDDVVSLSNLPRQVIYQPDQLGLFKVDAAKGWVEKQNPDVEVVAVNQRLSQLNAATLFEGVDLVLDCCDNFQTRMTINSQALKDAVPWVFAAVTDFELQLSFFNAADKGAPCFLCLFPEADATQDRLCDTQGVLGMTPGVAGVLQASEAIKYLLGLGGHLMGRLLIQNLLTHQSKVIKYRARTHCHH